MYTVIVKIGNLCFSAKNEKAFEEFNWPIFSVGDSVIFEELFGDQQAKVEKIGHYQKRVILTYDPYFVENANVFLSQCICVAVL